LKKGSIHSKLTSIFDFPFFLEKSPGDRRCRNLWITQSGSAPPLNKDEFDFVVTSIVPVTDPLPAAPRQSATMAPTNQRGQVIYSVRLKNSIWIEDLIVAGGKVAPVPGFSVY